MQGHPRLLISWSPGRRRRERARVLPITFTHRTVPADFGAGREPGAIIDFGEPGTSSPTPRHAGQPTARATRHGASCQLPTKDAWRGILKVIAIRFDRPRPAARLTTATRRPSVRVFTAPSAHPSLPRKLETGHRLALAPGGPPSRGAGHAYGGARRRRRRRRRRRHRTPSGARLHRRLPVRRQRAAAAVHVLWDARCPHLQGPPTTSFC